MSVCRHLEIEVFLALTGCKMVTRSLTDTHDPNADYRCGRSEITGNKEEETSISCDTKSIRIDRSEAK